MFSKKELYIAFLQASSVRYSSNALSDVAPIEISHDVLSKWLKTAQLRPAEVWYESKNYIDIQEPCLLLIDDTIIDKHHSEKIDIVRYLYSGNVHDVIKGFAVTNLVWNGLDKNNSLPIDFRVYVPEEDGKTKNDHFREMVKLAIERGIKPEAVIADTWYSSLNNLKMIRDLNLNWVMGLKKNRKVNRDIELQNLKIPEEGLKVHLRGYGWITVYRFVAKNGRTDYIGTNIELPTREKILGYVKKRWNIEIYHRELKQTCGLERCQARASRAQRNHVLLSILAWMQHYKRRCLDRVSYYQLKWETIKPAISSNIELLLLA
jgi:hypothetical protein